MTVAMAVAAAAGQQWRQQQWGATLISTMIALNWRQQYNRQTTETKTWAYEAAQLTRNLKSILFKKLSPF